jgi:predicted ATPase
MPPARAVVEVCQRLDGVPLAIERRGAVERHATLRAAIDWSFELLNAAEQRLLARIAVFTGGGTLEAIEEVCSGNPVERDEVMDLVTGLVSRSLVVAEDSVLGTRFRLLETIRQYGEERLTEWGETDALTVRHARFYADVSSRAAEHFYGPEQLVWARQINLEEDNIRSALANAIDTDDTALAVQLAANHPHHHSHAGTGEVFEVPASRVIEMPNARDEPGIPAW